MARNAFSFRGKLLLDGLIVSAFTLCFGMRFTGETAHEALGFVALLLLSAHLHGSRVWIGSVRSGAGVRKRWMTNLSNGLLFLSAIMLFGSGIVLFLSPEAGMAARQAHTVSAYWTLVLAGAHIGLYWDRVGGYLRRRLPQNVLSRAALQAFALYGIWASFERSMGEKLFQGISFDFWDVDRPAFLYFVNHLAVASLCAALARFASHFSVKKLHSRGHRRPGSHDAKTVNYVAVRQKHDI